MKKTNFIFAILLGLSVTFFVSSAIAVTWLGDVQTDVLKEAVKKESPTQSITFPAGVLPERKTILIQPSTCTFGKEYEDRDREGYRVYTKYCPLNIEEGWKVVKMTLYATDDRRRDTISIDEPLGWARLLRAGINPLTGTNYDGIFTHGIVYGTNVHGTGNCQVLLTFPELEMSQSCSSQYKDENNVFVIEVGDSIGNEGTLIEAKKLGGSLITLIKITIEKE